MKPQLSIKMTRLLDMIRSHPGQTANDYQALWDAEDEQMGIKGRTFSCPPAITTLNQNGYIEGTKPDGSRSWLWTALDKKAPNKATAPALATAEKGGEPKVPRRKRKTAVASLEVTYNLVLPTGRKLALTPHEARVLFDALKAQFGG